MPAISMATSVTAITSYELLTCAARIRAFADFPSRICSTWLFIRVGFLCLFFRSIVFLRSIARRGAARHPALERLTKRQQLSNCLHATSRLTILGVPDTHFSIGDGIQAPDSDHEFVRKSGCLELP